MKNKKQVNEMSAKLSIKTSKKLLTAVFMGLFCVGCASTQMQEELNTNSKSIARLDNKVSTMEGRMLAMGLEVKSSNERVYEVRNRSGRKTGMTAHPMQTQIPEVANNANRQANQSSRVVQPSPTKRQVAVAPSPKLQPKPMVAAPTATTLTAQNANKNITAPNQAQVNKPNSNISTGYNLALPPETAVLTPAAQNETTVSIPGNVVTAESVGITTPRSPTLSNTQTKPSGPQMPPADAPMLANANNKPQQVNAPAPAKFAPTASGEKDAYAQALKLVRGGQAQNGRESFRAFLATYPQSKLVPNAYYWIGESYYSQGNFGEALAAFQQVINRFPMHHKTADALLKAAMTYEKLGDVANAKTHYQKVVSTFPRSNAARIARNKRL